VISPYYFDCEFRQKLASDSVDFLAASYINGPQDPGIYFLDAQMRWQRHYSPRHGEAASILPEGMAVPVVEKTPNSPYPQGIAHFWDSFSTSRYHPDYALFYGRFKKMVLVFMFRPRSNVIFFMSPSGGGMQPDARTANPAWDWRIHLSGLKPNASASISVRGVYKQYKSDADILDEYRRWVSTCGTRLH
jgi:hypothetical protein